MALLAKPEIHRIESWQAALMVQHHSPQLCMERLLDKLVTAPRAVVRREARVDGAACFKGSAEVSPE